MVDEFGKLLVRAEHLRDGIFTPQDARALSRERLVEFEALGILAPGGHADEITYDGCDHECAVPNSGFEKHPDDPDRLICVHRCFNGCGRVIFQPQDFEQWVFNLVGLAAAVRDAIGASGTIVEDVPGRIVLVGTASVAGHVGEVFLGYGLARPDAATIAASATRLAASEHPAVLSVGTKPGDIWSLGKRPKTAVLAEHAHLSTRGILLDLATVFPAPGMVEVKPDAWITPTEAARLLMKDVSGLKDGAAKVRVTRAADAELFRTNGKSGRDRRIDRDSFSSWRLEQREKDLDEYDRMNS
ncbi:MAG: hypothetical protein R3B68_04305 [Phycisphaerales bacterium]